jgi:hypothetical protein
VRGAELDFRLMADTDGASKGYNAPTRNVASFLPADRRSGGDVSARSVQQKYRAQAAGSISCQGESSSERTVSCIPLRLRCHRSAAGFSLYWYRMRTPPWILIPRYLPWQDITWSIRSRVTECPVSYRHCGSSAPRLTISPVHRSHILSRPALLFTVPSRSNSPCCFLLHKAYSRTSAQAASHPAVHPRYTENPAAQRQSAGNVVWRKVH